MGSGKTTAAKFLSSRYQFQYVRYSQVLQEWLSSGEANRGGLQTLGWEVMAGGQQTELNRRLLSKLECTRSAAIDGLRHRVDFDSLSDFFGRSFQLVFLDASPEVRFERLRSRFPHREEFQAADSAPVEANINGLRQLATTTILNEASLASLYWELDSSVELSGARDQA